LTHEVLDDTVKGGILESKALFPSAQCLKFSAVFGTTSARSSMMIRPTGAPSAVISKYTLGFAIVENRRAKFLK